MEPFVLDFGGAFLESFFLGGHFDFERGSNFGFASFVVICLLHSFSAFVVHFFRRSSQLFCTAHVCSAGPSLFRHFFVSFQFVE